MYCTAVQLAVCHSRWAVSECEQRPNLRWWQASGRRQCGRRGTRRRLVLAQGRRLDKVCRFWWCCTPAPSTWIDRTTVPPLGLHRPGRRRPADVPAYGTGNNWRGGTGWIDLDANGGNMCDSGCGTTCTCSTTVAANACTSGPDERCCSACVYPCGSDSFMGSNHCADGPHGCSEHLSEGRCDLQC